MDVVKQPGRNRPEQRGADRSVSTGPDHEEVRVVGMGAQCGTRRPADELPLERDPADECSSSDRVDEMMEAVRGEIARIRKEERVCADRERRGVPHPHDHDRATRRGELDRPAKRRHFQP